MREIVLDTETTGLDPLGGHRIVEIGAVEVVDRMAAPWPPMSSGRKAGLAIKRKRLATSSYMSRSATHRKSS
jgi:hypothetical protein